MFATDDTIVALATPPGRGALGIVRISGPRSLDIFCGISRRRRPLQPRRATLTRIQSGAGTSAAVDRVIATYFQAPQSYTGEDVVELCAHGSPVLLRTILHAAVDAGARLARPGEFTLRAFLAGRIDLVQAEAVRDLVAAATPLQVRVAFDQLDGTLTRRIAALDSVLFDLIARLEASLDFPDEGYHFVHAAETRERISRVIDDLSSLLGDARRGRLIREGVTVVLAGRPNVGKSSLFNALAGADRAIVTSVPGTTRDLITEPIDIQGIAVTLVDTAGARRADDLVEREGVARGEQARAVADLIIVVLDCSEPLTDDDCRLLEQTASRPRLIVANKCDLPRAASAADAIDVSAVTGHALQKLRCAIADALSGGDDAVVEPPALTNLRHVLLLEQARASLQRAVDALDAGGIPEEFLLTDLHSARMRFDEVVGSRTSEDVLTHIFETFCIGK
jgi:tRNA modification GTPase